MQVKRITGGIELRKPFGNPETAGKRAFAEAVILLPNQVVRTVEAVVKRC
jgi:hypothetical protein